MSKKLRWAALAYKNNQSNINMIKGFEKFAAELADSVCEDIVKPGVERNLELFPDKVKAIIQTLQLFQVIIFEKTN
jgi:hypothetical protein